MIIAPQELSSPYKNILNDNDIDWDDNCIFENGKVVGFKKDKASNHRQMRPIPKGERAINESLEAKRYLDSQMQPVTKEQFAVIFKKLHILSGKQNRSPEEMKYMFNDYYADLSKYPAKLIESACAAYRKLPEGNEFMPTSGKLISLMADEWAKLLFQKSRVDKILNNVK